MASEVTGTRGWPISPGARGWTDLGLIISTWKYQFRETRRYSLHREKSEGNLFQFFFSMLLRSVKERRRITKQDHKEGVQKQERFTRTRSPAPACPVESTTEMTECRSLTPAISSRRSGARLALMVLTPSLSQICRCSWKTTCR